MRYQGVACNVLIALRQARKYTRSVTAFANLVGWSYHTLRRLEQVKWDTSPKTWHHPWDYADLEPLLNAACCSAAMSSGCSSRRPSLAVVGAALWGAGLRSGDLGGSASWHRSWRARDRDGAGDWAREMRKLAAKSEDLSETTLALATERVLSEVVFRLATTGFILTKEMGGPILPDTEQTRALEGLLTPGAGAETPYLRTLRMAYEWAEEAFGRELQHRLPGSDWPAQPHG